jgi:hypothetical protein
MSPPNLNFAGFRRKATDEGLESMQKLFKYFQTSEVYFVISQHVKRKFLTM